MTLRLICIALVTVIVCLLPASAQNAPSSASSVKKVYWSSDPNKCSICDKITIDGIAYYIFDTPDAELVYTGMVNSKLIFSQVYVRNKSNNRIEFNSKRSVLVVFKKLDDKPPLLVWPMVPRDAAKKMKGSQRFKNWLTDIGASMRSHTIVAQSTSSGTVSVKDAYGNSASGTYDGQTMSTVSVPNREALAAAEATKARRNAAADARYDDYLSNALLSNTIFANESIQGYIYFPRTSGNYMFIGIHVGDTLYLTGIAGLK